jgi:hypothetical protein
MRRLRTLLCLSLLAVPLQAASALTAHADVVVDTGTVQCTANGALSTSLGPVPQTVAFTGSLTLSCVGVGDDAGTWTLTMSGQMSPGFCAGGQGLATVGGNGPDGNVGAGLRLTSSATTLHMAGTLGTNDAGGDAFKADLAMTPTSGIPCVNTVTQENLSGEASITDLPAPPDLVFCTVNGVENYAPGIGLVPTPIAVNGNANFNCTNPVSDDAGPWALNYNGTLTADCGLAEGSVAFGFNGPDATTTGTANYERVGTMLDIVGSSNDDTWEIWGQMAPNSNCVNGAWTVSNYTAVAAIVE